jgi:hypothetical protein
VLEELEDIIASDDTFLAGENLSSMVVSCCCGGALERGVSRAALTSLAETIVYVM